MNMKQQLPPYIGKAELIKQRQSVNDIVFEILDAHRQFASQYDKICSSFDSDTTQAVCNNLFSWCKKNIHYRMESEERQTTKSPAAMLAHGYGDCKHYASFCGGILDALNRKGRKINWCYRFASYNIINNTPEHIFVVVKTGSREIWIDPTPGANKVKPVWQLDKKIKVMPLYRVSGIGYTPKNYPISDLIANIDSDIDQELFNAIQILLKYGVMDVNAKLHDRVLIGLQTKLPAFEFNSLAMARQLVQNARIGGLFQDIWKGVKTVSLAIPRNAYLSLVGINAFNYATKLSKAIFNADGSYSGGYDRLKKKWESLGGSWSALVNTIKHGATKKAVLGVAPAAPAAWVTAATAIIAALTPIIKDLLSAKGMSGEIPPPVYGDPYPLPPVSAGGGIMDWIKQNPIPAAGIGIAVFMLLKKRSA